MTVKTLCKLGGETENNYLEFVNACECNQSCEPHIHEKDGTILCLHDGETDHGHCPQADTSTMSYSQSQEHTKK